MSDSEFGDSTTEDEEYLLNDADTLNDAMTTKINETYVMSDLGNEKKSIDVELVDEKDDYTTDIITRFELTAVITKRVEEINRGSPVFVDVDPYSTPEDIALKEIHQKKCPYMILRQLTPSSFVLKKVNDLIIKSLN